MVPCATQRALLVRVNVGWRLGEDDAEAETEAGAEAEAGVEA